MNLKYLVKEKMYIEKLSSWLLFPYKTWMINRKIIFIHIPKTAGTSILHAMNVQDRPRLHLPWYIYHEKSRARFERYFKFAFVRNPWDRAFSAYNYLIQGGNKTTDKNYSFWLQKSFPDFDSFVIDGLGAGIARSGLLFAPQANFITDGSGIFKVDFIGKLESITEDIQKLSTHLSIDTKIKKLNHSRRELDYRFAYKKNESIEIISELYAQDVKLFHYFFD
ncbi:sulfotransferase family 2 domain-containing protein [Thiorhodovibrio frisius]|uniref:Sulfotransferase family n=1 Tax=Thiorhodovibrio frisius TaxID=631362 RepID=H8Z0R6_9GAMM|nr:sulfotransferase family 2 domain-containing protein [Thiorhodovibrio frisius]EIC21298.1 Sulfotransferase family [Thiorhodovibrio frisius]WPL23880.1 Sulfotransferase family protein [Thiorhodovibrio frisius]